MNRAYWPWGSGIAVGEVTVGLVPHHSCVRLCGISTYVLNGLSKADEHSAFISIRSVAWHLLLYLPFSPFHVCFCTHFLVSPSANQKNLMLVSSTFELAKLSGL